jgi:integral membrane sensor domain MASE1
LTGSWWALIGPAAVALLLLGVFDTRLENTGTTWGEAFAMAIAVPSALLVAFGVAWRRDRNRTRHGLASRFTA